MLKKFQKMVIISSVVSGVLYGQNFEDRVTKLFEEHNLINKVKFDLSSSLEKYEAAKGDYYPTISLKGSIGSDDIVRKQGESGTYEPKKASVELRQLVTDFGLTDKRIEAAKTIADKEAVERDLQKQNLLLAAIEAQLQLIKSDKLHGFATKSESNIKEQTRLENTRLERGKGYSTDVLQSKAQLLGAESGRIFAEGQKSISMYRYQAVFANEKPNVAELKFFSVPTQLIPNSLEEVEKLIISENPDIKAEQARAQIAIADKNVVSKKEYMPTLYLDASKSFSEEMDGVLGKRYDTKVALNFNWNFNLGGKAKNNVNSAKFNALSANEKVEYTKVQVLEEGRRAWNQLQVAKQRTEYLKSQVTIQNEFLSLAKKERELGRRSLIDILNGETSLLRAESDYTAAVIEEAISSFKLLRSIGKLDFNLFKDKNIYVSQDTLFKN